MTVSQTGVSTLRKPLRLWPGIVLAGLMVLTALLVPLVVADGTMYAVMGGVLGGFLIFLWWMFFSRARWSERLSVLAVMIAGTLATSLAVHESIRTGMMGMMLAVYSIPVLSLALVIWAVTTRHLAARARRAAMGVVVLIACGIWTLVRTDGVAGDGSAEFEWRWTETAEERLLAQTGNEPAPRVVVPAASAGPPAPPARKEAGAPATTPDTTPVTTPVTAPPTEMPAATAVSWPGFRGARRDGVTGEVRIRTDWGASPPVELWRRAIGPGWSSFAVRGDFLFTQEQRGENEIVACYRATSGEPVWVHTDNIRFWESNGGAGPRATPTVSGDRVYAMGATGLVNALDALTGSVVWSRNAASDTGGTVPYWGIASSPLVVEDTVIVYAGGLAAYDRATGKPRWIGKTAGDSYSSPHLATIDGVVQVLQSTAQGMMSVAPADGRVLWEYAWPGGPIVQPALMAGGNVLLTTGGNTGGLGLRRLAISQKPDGWTVEERWTSPGLKPYFNDFVVHKGHAFGFDGRILSCINLEDGQRKWKGGRYGNGQLILLPDQDLLLVLSEEGELALVSATPDQFTEVARVPAIEGKTWNHPALIGDVVLVRNGEEMAAFRLPRADR
jgi:outer membrane protein assembly factor BamB